MPELRIDPRVVADTLARQAERFAVVLGPEEVGRVLEAGDGIARVDGLPGVMAEEMVLFPHDVHGMAMNLERREVGIIVLGDYARVEQGQTVRRTGRVLEVPVGPPLLGRVVTPLGQPMDGRGPILGAVMRRVEQDAPGIVDRQPVARPLQTGIRSVDAMTAIGRGQRELIIGDRQTGKTTLALDAMLNQAGGDMLCVYVAIGQKMSNVARVARTLEAHDALRNTIIVAATASDSAPLQYIAPFAACAMAEFFRDQGRDVLIVYDDLTKHAIAYREISLLLRRPPGREAFPGDIFYLHSRLLERAGQLHARLGGGSLTALPIVETQQGDYAAYIPTNLISITDGQIYLEGALFHQGFRPAMNVGLSVSRVGGKAQRPAMKQVAAQLRLELAQYREVASFAQLTADLDDATLRQLHRGERLAEILKQPQHSPMPVEQQIALLWAATRGQLDDLPLADVARFAREWLALLRNGWAATLRRIQESGRLTEADTADLTAAVDQCKGLFAVSGAPDTLGHNRVVMPADDSAVRVSETIVKSA